MSYLIRREDAIEAIYEHEFSNWCDKDEVSTILYDLPSADRLQGEWIKFGLGRGTRILFCTNCERRIEVPLSQGDSNYDFCPNCGARMKGASNGEDIQSADE